MKNNNLYLIAASISLLIAVYLWFTGQKDAGVFVGLWVPSILTLGLYMQSSRERS